ncbi:MAG: hypothetical protein KDE47_22760 [Caldilineaceae bacterium]|nr:hypothetical protein [Caldilineaceae bacterium]
MLQPNVLERIEGLEEFAAAEGFTLPMPALEIVRLEDQGFVIDLHTGQILEDVDIDEQLDIIVAGVAYER